VAGTFQPNKALDVTPEFLERAIRWLKRRSYEFVSLDEARARLVDRNFNKRFVVITLDDGYRDNKSFALPVFARHQVPYALYVPIDFADGKGNLWWDVIEHVVAVNTTLEVEGHHLSCASVKEKYQAFAVLKRMLLDQPSQAAEAEFIVHLAARYCPDAVAGARAECMTWDEIREVAADPRATIGAHTITHPLLAKAAEAQAVAELTQSRRVLEEKLQREIVHLSYPYGDAGAVGEREFRVAREAGYRTAVTTRAGVVTAADGQRMLALPRINLDGDLQEERYLDVLMSGVAQVAWHALKRVRDTARRPVSAT
jgi:peptidoglycan/xylan/chitin deacetylase (PgdA/CDA1 family)